MNAHWFLLFTLLALFVQGVFVFFEMAAISFNKMRLQYYVSLGKKRAIWLQYLVQRPSRLFGTALLGINTALQVGSECSRRFYESIHLDPDWAPLTQVLIVVIFAELVPMFAARRHPEQSALALVPLMAFLARLLQPIIWCFDTLSSLIHRSMGTAAPPSLFFSREEVKMAFEERGEGEDESNALVRQIFQMKFRTAGHIMTPLDKVPLLPSSAVLGDARALLSSRSIPFLPMYHRQPHNVIGIVHMSDLLKLSEEQKKLIDVARSPWFVAKEALIFGILEQFRSNNQSVAIILDPTGQACGILTLDQVIAQIFGEEERGEMMEETPFYVERTLSGSMKVADFNQEFQGDLLYEPGETLSDLVVRELDHSPTRGETLKIGSFRFTVMEVTLTEVKVLSVQSLQE